MIKRHIFTLFIVLTIIILSLAPMQQMPQVHVRFIDKWVHLLMYAGVSFAAWIDQLRIKGKPSFVADMAWAVIMPICLGGAMEVAQDKFTTNRSGEMLDFLADAVGVVLATIAVFVGWTFFHRYLRKRT